MGAKKKWCCVPGCNFFAVTGDGRTVFHFPSNPDRRRQWIKAIGNASLLSTKLTTIASTRYVCPAHFLPNMFKDKYKYNLMPNACPAIFPEGHNDLSNIQMAGWDATHGKLSGQKIQSGNEGSVFVFGADTNTLPPPPRPSSPDRSSMSSSTTAVFLWENDAPTFPAGSKRPLPTSSQTTDDELDVLEESKRPKLDIIEPESGFPRRRSAESTGARERSKPPERMSLQGIANKAGVTGTLTPNEKKLARAAQDYRQMAHRFRRNLTISQRKNGNLKKLAKPKFIDMVDDMCISKVTKNIVKSEMRNFKKKPNGRSWNTSDKLFALSIYKRSARAYRFMREYIMLPSESTLKSMLDKVPIKPGISDVFVSMLKHKLTKMSSVEKVCVVSFDEMFLRGNLYHHHGLNIIDGFEDYGHRGRTNRIADHALVFMAQGLESKWVMPVAYFLVSKTCPSSMLKLLIQDVVSTLTSIGFTVVGSVSDQGSNNRGAISELRKESGDTIFYYVGQTRLVHIWDMPHILKNVRNNLLSSDVEFKPGKIAKWRHLIEYFKLDETLYGLSPLTYRHLNPTGRDKMRVPLAAQVLSTNVSLSIKNAYHLSNGSRLGECLPFAEFCSEVDTFFDLCNGPRKGEKVKEHRVDVTAASVHHTMWDKMLNSLQKWVFIRKSDGTRHVPHCIKGWIENIKSFRMLWRKVEAAGLDILRLRHINQDPVENLFCLIRQCGGSSTDITVKQFIAALKTCLITRFASPVKDKNCIDDDSYFLNTLQPLLNLMPHEEHQLPQETSLIRGDTLEFNEAGAAVESQTTHLLKSVMSGLSRDIKCSSCLALLTSSQPSQNAIFALDSTFSSFPSSILVACFIEARKLFESKFKEILHKSEVVAEVGKACDCVIRYQSLLCPEHQEDSFNRGLISEKIAEVLIKTKVAFCNAKFKEKVVRRTRQADAKTSVGLRQSEEEAELSHSDVQLLLGTQSGPCEPTPQRLSRIPVTGLSHMFPAPTTPQRLSRMPVTGFRTPFPVPTTPQRLNRIPETGLVTPQPQSPATPLLTPARQKVHEMWQASTPQPAAQGDHVEDLAKNNKLESLTIPKLKNFLKERGLRVGGNKGELILRIHNYFNLV